MKIALLCHIGPSAAGEGFSFSSIVYCCFKGKKQSPFGFTMLSVPESLCLSIIYFANRRMRGRPFGRWEKSRKLPSVLNIKYPL